MRDKLARFFAGRNGMDNYTRFLIWSSLIPFIVSMFTGGVMGGIVSAVLFLFAAALLAYGYFRMLSKNVYKRQTENKKYLAAKSKITGELAFLKMRIVQRKLYKFYTCPKCRAHLRVPRGKGEITLTCSKCGHRFSGKT